MIQFGLYLDLGAGASFPERVSDFVRLVEVAERHGFDSVWSGESYRQNARERRDDYPPGALLFLSMLVRSTTLRLGTGVVVLPATTPLRLAYETALVDQISEGRLAVGVAQGRPPLQRRFGLDPATIGEWTDEVLACLHALWSGAKGFDGRLVKVDGGIDPLPFQPGGPPLWIGGYTQRAVRRAAEHGAALYLGTPASIDLVRQVSAAYRSILAEGGATDRVPVLAVNRLALVAPSDEEALDLARRYLGTKLRLYAEAGSLRPPASRPGLTAAELVDELRDRYCLIGSPESVTRQVAAYQRAGVNEIHVRVSAGGVPFAVASRSIELLGSEVIPAVREMPDVRYDLGRAAGSGS